MKKTFLSALRAMCAGVMTLCMGSLAFVSCYDDTELQNKYKDLDGRLAVVEQLAKALEERADDALYTLEFQISSSNELQYSFDGGETWNATGVTATDGISVSDVEDDDDSITFIFSDGSSFTVEKPVEVQFEIRSGKVFFGDDNETRIIKVLTSGISDLTAFAAPRGWFAEVNADGNVEVTSPADDDNNAVSSGYVKLHACGQDGKCYVGRFLVGKGKMEVYAYNGKAYFAGMPEYIYGVSTAETIEEDTQLARTVFGMPDGEEKWAILDGITNMIGWESNPGANGEEVTKNIADLLGSPLVVGTEYIVWALKDTFKTTPYTMEDIVMVYYTHRQITASATENRDKKTPKMIDINVSVEGAEGYLAVSIPAIYAEKDINAFKAQTIEWLTSGDLDNAGKIYTENYTGSLLNIAEGTQAFAGDELYEPYSDYYLCILPLDGRPYDRYKVSDVKGFTFKTAELSAGGAVAASAAQVFETWGEPVDEYTGISVDVKIANENDNWTTFYHIWLTDAQYKQYTSDQALVNAVFSQDVVAPMTKNDFMMDYGGQFPFNVTNWDAMNATYWFVGFFTDADGKYGELAKVQCAPQKSYTSPDGTQLTFGWSAMGGVPALLDLGVANDGEIVVGLDYNTAYGQQILPENTYAIYNKWTYAVYPMSATEGTIEVFTTDHFGDVISAAGTYSDWNGASCKVSFEILMLEDVEMTVSSTEIALVDPNAPGAEM